MLSLKKFSKRVIHAGGGDLQPLIDMLPGYGMPGVYAMLDIANNPNHSESVRMNALLVLGVNNYQLPNGLPFVMEAVEALAETAPPDLDLVCFASVYGNAIKGRKEAIALVERFKVGTPRQKQVFIEIDREFMRGLKARYIVQQYEDKRQK